MLGSPCGWLLVPRASVQHPPARLWRASAPLFVEVGDAGRHAAVPDVPHPIWVAATMSDPAFPAGDHPVQAREGELIYRPEEGLGTDKADRSRNPALVVRAPDVRFRLHGNADPDVLGDDGTHLQILAPALGRSCRWPSELSWTCVILVSRLAYRPELEAFIRRGTSGLRAGEHYTSRPRSGSPTSWWAPGDGRTARTRDRQGMSERASDDTFPERYAVIGVRLWGESLGRGEQAPCGAWGGAGQQFDQVRRARWIQEMTMRIEDADGAGEEEGWSDVTGDGCGEVDVRLINWIVI